MGLGFVKFSVDVEAVENHLSTKQGVKELKGLVEVIPMSVTTPAKVKVNTKRVSANNVEMIETDEILVIEEEQYENQKQVA
jgi:type III secretory pathway component EscR